MDPDHTRVAVTPGAERRDSPYLGGSGGQRSQCLGGITIVLSQRQTAAEHQPSCRMMEAPHDRRWMPKGEKRPRTAAKTNAALGLLMDTLTTDFVRAGSLEELKAKGRLVAHGPHRPILVVHDKDRIFALDNRCPHMGFPLDRGSVEDGTLTCHWHHARFDLASGCTFDLWADDVPTCPVEVRDGEVWVRPIFGHPDPAAHWCQRLDDGLAHILGLVIAKAVHGQIAAGVPPLDVVRQVTLFGIQNRDSWGVGLTILTALACRNRRPTSPCSTAPAASRQIATARHLGGGVLRSPAGPMSRPLSAGCGVGQRCAIARRPSALCSPPSP